ncbi:hypothetical protein DFH09DRAFT_1091081 [Mycena vulgaris]|nr:hypothetical protein DFH09DRAFT_1091081 [Mycena vulgaris]
MAVTYPGNFLTATGAFVTPVSVLRTPDTSNDRDGLEQAVGVPIGNLMLGFFDVAQASASLRSLVIPRTSPSLKSFTTIPSLFPELQELSIDIANDDDMGFGSFFMCRKGRGEIDTRTIELCDDEAFELHYNYCKLLTRTLRPPSTGYLPALLSSPNSRGASLPLCTNRFDFSLEHQHQIVAALSGLHPVLREVEIGYPMHTWERAGTLLGRGKRVR